MARGPGRGGRARSGGRAPWGALSSIGRGASPRRAGSSSPTGRRDLPGTGEPPPAGEFSGVRAVDYCGTCSLLVRASTWDRVGGADETLYPLYYVDVDLCLGIRARGERVLCEPASVVTHLGGGEHDARLRAVRDRPQPGQAAREVGAAGHARHLPGSGATFRLESASLPGQGREADPLARERETAREFAADQRRRLAARAAELSAVHEHLASLRPCVTASPESSNGHWSRSAARTRADGRARELTPRRGTPGWSRSTGSSRARDAGWWIGARPGAEAVEIDELRGRRVGRDRRLVAARDAPLPRRSGGRRAEARAAALAGLEARAAAESDRAASAEARAAVIEAELASLASEAVWLRGRAETLARVEAGGWWRLRGRIRPLLLAARAAELYVRRLRR